MNLRTREFESALNRAWSWAAARDFVGYDPYDALHSPLISKLHHILGRSFGITTTQALRRSPINLRPLLHILPAANSKGLGLFLSAAARSGRLEDVAILGRRLRAMQVPGWGTPCWGYPFPWRSRAFFLPANTPTVVATSFVGEAYLDAFSMTEDSQDLDTALGACTFVMDRLHRTKDSTGVCLSYSPLDKTAVYNASLLAARLLVRAGVASGRDELIAHAEPLFRFALARQRQDGSWTYGAASYHQWIDSFHTGFILGAIDVFARTARDVAAMNAVVRGAAFYVDHFFGPNGEPYYFAHTTRPYDVHAAAQGAITLMQLRDIDRSFGALAERVGRFLVDQFLAPDGHFIYQLRRTHRVSIPYMRWSQAWGVRALVALCDSAS